MIKKYRKKPVMVEAMEYTGHNYDEVAAWVYNQSNQEQETWKSPINIMNFYITTLEGDFRVKPGDYIIQGVEGEFYPCKPEIFAQTYEAVDVPKTKEI